MTTLSELEALAKAATPGPWANYDARVHFAGIAGGFSLHYCPLPYENAAFIAAANPVTILELIALLRQAREALKYLWITCPTALECNSFHHAKRDQHSYNEECKPREEYLRAIESAEASVAAIDAWEKK